MSSATCGKRCSPEFKAVVLRRFRKKVFGDLEGDLEEQFKSKQEVFLKAPDHQPDIVIERLQQRLAPRLLAGRRDVVRGAFGFWFIPHGKETRILRQKIEEWSKR